MYAQYQVGINCESDLSRLKSASDHHGAFKNEKRAHFSFVAGAAQKVFLVGSFNSWGESHKMLRDGFAFKIDLGADEISDGDVYKFKVYTDSDVIYVSDPNSPETDGEPFFNSVYRESECPKVQRKPFTKPLNVYLVKANAWAYGSDGKPLPYEMLSNELLPYLMQMGYTHVAVSRMLDGNSNAPRAEQGGIDGFRELVRKMHSKRIEVLIVAECAETNAHRAAEFLAYWTDVLNADGILIDAPQKTNLEFYYELYSSVKRINSEISVIANRDKQIPADITVRECPPCDDPTRIAAEAKEILLGDGMMLTRAGTELGSADRSTPFDYKRAERADIAALQRHLSDLNRIYLSNREMWQNDAQITTVKEELDITKTF